MRLSGVRSNKNFRDIDQSKHSLEVQLAESEAAHESELQATSEISLGDLN